MLQSTTTSVTTSTSTAAAGEASGVAASSLQKPPLPATPSTVRVATTSTTTTPVAWALRTSLTARRSRPPPSSLRTSTGHPDDRSSDTHSLVQLLVNHSRTHFFALTKEPPTDSLNYNSSTILFLFKQLITYR